MASREMEHSESIIKTKTGTTITQLVTALQSLNNNQKETSALRVESGANVYILRESWEGVWSAFSMGGGSQGTAGYNSVVFVLNGSSSTLIRRKNVYGSSTYTDETVTPTSWKLMYFE